MADTAMSVYIGDAGKIIVSDERFLREIGAIRTDFVANGSDIKPGYVVTQTGETAPDVDLQGNGEVALGIALEDPTGEHSDDVDDAWDDNYEIRVLLIPVPAIAWVAGDDAAAAAYVWGAPHTAGATAGTVNDAVVDFEADYVGKAAQSGTSATDLFALKLWLG
jgi:hypothetical protein